MGRVKAKVRDAESASDLDEVRRLFREFVAWHSQRQPKNLELVTAYFDDDAWEAERDGLPGVYAATEGGALLLATMGGNPVGCVALRQLDDESCEMKRMYVDGAGRGHGAGRALAEAVIERARGLGYTAMYLDTSTEQHEAIGLYRSLGFEQVEPYYDVAPQQREWLVFFRKAL